MKDGKPHICSKRITDFFVISHGIPLLITLAAMLAGGAVVIANPFHRNLLYIGFLSPTIAALYVLFKHHNASERKDYWQRVIDFRRVSWRGCLIIFTFPILIRFMAAAVAAGITIDKLEFFISPSMTIPYALFLLFFGPVPEELGWRGVVLPDLNERLGFNRAVLLLGFMWAVWHLPMFFVQGTYQNQLGLYTPLFWCFMLGVIFNSVISGAVYFSTNGSILAAILFHYVDNLAGETFVMTFEASIIELILKGVAAVLILIYYTANMDRYWNQRRRLKISK